MKVVAIENWASFEEEIEKLYELTDGARKNAGGVYVSRPLFRGQRNATWKLETSLERYLGSDIGLQQYNKYLLRIKPSVEAFTQKDWSLSKQVSLKDTSFQSVTNYEFMVYARHHGFPSPLLDWSQSPYVALFFAAQTAKKGEDIAVFAYIDDIGKGRGGWVGAPCVSEQGEYVNAHRRHFMQQSQYTIATKKENNRWVYCSHHDYFDEGEDEHQALLFKFVLDSEQRVSYLRKLQKMNINAYTLYGSEESLMDMLAFREIVEKDL